MRRTVGICIVQIIQMSVRREKNELPQVSGPLLPAGHENEDQGCDEILRPENDAV